MTPTTDTTDTTTNSNGTRGRRSKREQLNVPGTERQYIAAVEDAANAYRNARDERMEMTKLEVVRRDELIRVMGEHKLDVYKYDDEEGEELTVKLATKTKVRVKRSSSPDKDEDSEI